MAGTKINTKKKEEKSKSGRIAGQSIEETEDLDFSLLRKPIHTSITGFAQARKIFDLATEELKGLLSNECDLLYECKICRNIFRSLANFISHKRVYCKGKFNPSEHGHFIRNSSSMNEILKIRKLEEIYQEALNNDNDSNSMVVEENEERIPLSKDLTDIVERISNTKGIEENQLKDHKLVFQKIPKSSVAVFQNIDTDENKNDTMKEQVKELDTMLSQENAVLQSDGTFKVQSSNVQLNSENIIQISDDDDNEDVPYSVRHGVLKCEICDLQFSTQKTLKFHMKYKHLESRLVYPCPDCLDIFSTSWSVYRHLFKVHRKTAAQIRRLRESIQAKAFKMNNPPAFYEKRKSVLKNFPAQKITEEERIYQENQAWAEELEGEGEGRRCGGCGRAFERRAALAAHAHTCARRHTRRIQIQIRKDYNKEPSTPYLVMNRTQENKAAEEKPEKLQEKESKAPEPKPLEEAVMSTIDVKQSEDEDHTESETRVIPTQNILQCYSNTLINKLPFAQQAEKSNLNAFKQRMQADVEIDQLLCRKCNNKFEQIGELIEHVAGHYKWLRYACKLCNFKHFNFNKLPEHVKVVHKLKGDTDFYYSTVKAIDGSEASELSGPVEELTESNETSPDSRRPSRCSSDSSRLSDDSSSSSTRVEVGSRKRKARLVKNIVKKKKETVVIDEIEENKEVLHKGVLLENDSSSNTKLFEENSSDFDEVDDKIAKRENKTTSVALRRPVRKKTKRKNEDFEYDLSNLLKMEAQGYRDSQIVTTKSVQNKKKTQQDLQQHYDIINKDCCGALVAMSRMSLEKAQGHMKTTSFSTFNTSKESRVTNIFVRPMIPKINRLDKISPKKTENEDFKEASTSSPSKIIESANLSSLCKELVITKVVKKKPEEKEPDKIPPSKASKETENKPEIDNKIDIGNKEIKEEKDKVLETELKSEENVSEQSKPNLNIPAILPIKFRRQSLDVIQNPLIKKNITDFTKAGMKTKILVIKPINRNTDGTKTLKFQTIKLKDPNKTNNVSEDIKSDQVVVVKVPKVECSVTRPKSVVNNMLMITDGKCDENENEKPKTNLTPTTATVINTITENDCIKDIKIKNETTFEDQSKPVTKLKATHELEEALIQSGLNSI